MDGWTGTCSLDPGGRVVEENVEVKETFSGAVPLSDGTRTFLRACVGAAEVAAEYLPGAKLVLKLCAAIWDRFQAQRDLQDLVGDVKGLVTEVAATVVKGQTTFSDESFERIRSILESIQSHVSKVQKRQRFSSWWNAKADKAALEGLAGDLRTAMADPGVMACGDSGELPLLGGPLEHRSEFHRAVALGAGQGCDAVAVAVHQPLHNFLLEGVSRVHHVMGDAELLADSGCIDEAFGAAGAFATHQPKREALDLPTRLHQEGCGQGTVHSAGQTNGYTVLPWPGPQPIQRCLPCS